MDEKFPIDSIEASFLGNPPWYKSRRIKSANGWFGRFMLVHVDYLGVSKNRVGITPNHPFVHRVFPYFHHPFWGYSIPPVLETPILFPNAPCREYLPTFPLECSHFSPNVGKYSIQGASGVGIFCPPNSLKFQARWRQSRDPSPRSIDVRLRFFLLLENPGWENRVNCIMLKC